MKKIALFLCLICLLTGCENSQKVYEEQKTKYENYMELIIDNSKQITTNIPFSWHFNMSESDGKYVYEIIITDPKIEMNNIQMVAADIEQIDETTIAPNLGLFEEKKYNMIPNQANIDKGYYRGVGLNGISYKDKFVLNCLVVYKDKNQQDNYVYIIINADIDDFIEDEETINENDKETTNEKTVDEGTTNEGNE